MTMKLVSVDRAFLCVGFSLVTINLRTRFGRFTASEQDLLNFVLEKATAGWRRVKLCDIVSNTDESQRCALMRHPRHYSVFGLGIAN